MARKGIRGGSAGNRRWPGQAARLTSLTALATATLAAAGASPADATPIVYSGPDLEVGFGGGFAANLTLTLTPPGGSATSIYFKRIQSKGSGYGTQAVSVYGKNGNVRFRGIATGATASPLKFAAIAGSGKTFSRTGKSSIDRGIVGLRATFSGSTTLLPAASEKGYALFSFDSGQDFGWIALSLNSTASGPQVTISSYAFEDGGQHLAAGDTGPAPAPVPEPSSLPIELSGLGAMVLGAAGLRRWRAARAAA
jgi:hypothetical protein